MEVHLQKIEEIMNRSRKGEESFQLDTKTAAKTIIEYLKEKDLIKKPEKKVEY